MLAGLLLSITPIGAEEIAPVTAGDACRQVEIVFLVDQSGSMGGLAAGSTVHPRPNDPLGLRFHGPIFAMRWLGNDFLVSRGIPGRPRVTFHMAVVNFGDSPEVALDWTTLAPKDAASWKRLAASLEQKLAPGPLATSNLGQTNFLEAFRQVADLFAQRGPQQDGCPRRAVVVLTDGEPSVDEDGFTIGGHMRSVEDLINRRLPPPGYRIYITGINDPDQPGSWNRMVSYWEAISQDDPNLAVRRTQLVVSPDQIGDRLNQILFELRGVPRPPRPPIGRPFVVQPYLQEICFIFFKRDPANEHLIVRDEFGLFDTSRTDVEIEIIGYEEPIETLCVKLPLPGRWVLETTAERADVLINKFEIPTAGTLKSPTGTTALQYLRTTVEFQLVDSQGQPLPEYPDPRYQIQITATVSAAGRMWPISVRREPQQTFIADFVPVEAGKHTLTVRGVSQDIEGKVVEVIAGEIGDFLVSPVTLEQLSGPDGIPGGCGPQQGLPLSIAYGFRGPDGQSVVTDVPIRWDVSATANGQTWLLPMQGPSATGVYSTTFTPEVSGLHELHVTATLIEPIGGVERQILNTGFSLNVAPTELVTLRLTRPQSGQRVGRSLRFQWTPPFIRLEQEPLDVEADLVHVDDGSPADLAKISNANPDRLLKLEVREAVTGQPISNVPVLRPTGNPGQFRARIEGLALGKYVLSVRPASDITLHCGFGWADDSQVVVELELIQDPQLWRLAGVLAIVLGAFIAFVSYRWHLTRYPCHGWLVILDASGRRVAGGLYGLSGRHYHVRSDVPPEVGIRKLIVSCRKEWKDEHHIHVRMIPYDGPVVEFEMTPGKRNIINNYSLLYVRDQQDIPR
jgi:hypothetical protein